MSENNYGALMMKSALSANDDIDTILIPGIYPVASGNLSSPDQSGGVLMIHAATPKRREFISNSVVKAISTYNSITTKWEDWHFAVPLDDLSSNKKALGFRLLDLSKVEPGKIQFIG